MDVVVAGADEEVAVAGCCVGDEEVGGDVAGEEEDCVEQERVEHFDVVGSPGAGQQPWCVFRSEVDLVELFESPNSRRPCGWLQ